MRNRKSRQCDLLPGRRSLAKAISAIIAAGGPPAALAQDQGGGLEEIIVTARKREESLQDIPLSVQAFTSDDIERYGFKGVADYTRFIPSLKYVSSSPGQTKLIFRGVADSASPFIADASAAIYLDEQPLT
jgi:outer membrane receptor protein involved in Fe transport